MMMQDIVRTLFTASVFGSILFFATTVGPTVFKVLEGDEASTFLRRLIPRYYMFLIITAGLGAFSSWEHSLQALGLGAISISSMYMRQIALPQILEWRDQQMDGDQAAAQKFIRGRRAALVLTAVQLLVAGGVLARVAG